MWELLSVSTTLGVVAHPRYAHLHRFHSAENVVSAYRLFRSQVGIQPNAQ